MKEIRKYKSLMVEVDTHYKIVVEAKKRKLTIDKFIRELYEKRNNNPKTS